MYEVLPFSNKWVENLKCIEADIELDTCIWEGERRRCLVELQNFWLYIKFKIPDIRSLIGKKSSSSPLPHFRNYTCHGYGGERIILYILLLANKPMFFPIIYGFFFWRVKFLFFVFILNPSIPRDDGFKPTQWHAFLGRECIWYC